MSRAGVLVDGYAGGWNWSRDGEQVASIGFSIAGDVLTRRYGFRRHGEERKQVDEQVRALRSPRPLGGERTYFQCPRVVSGRVCARRLVKLCGAFDFFLCRHFRHLSYSSQSSFPAARVVRRAGRLEIAPGGKPRLSSAFPRRPKGMWRKTCEWEMAAIFEVEEAADATFARECARIMKRLG